MYSCQQYRQQLLISPGHVHLRKGCKEGFLKEGLISEGAFNRRDLYPRGLVHLCKGFIGGLVKGGDYTRGGLYPRGLLNGGTYILAGFYIFVKGL